MAAEKTVRLTAAEIEKTRAAPRIGGELQRATIDARLRTGLRLGTQVGGGRIDVVATAYRLNGKGRPMGFADVHVIEPALSVEDAIAVLDGLAMREA